MLFSHAHDGLVRNIYCVQGSKKTVVINICYSNSLALVHIGLELKKKLLGKIEMRSSPGEDMVNSVSPAVRGYGCYCWEKH